ncbi:MAG: polyhydroxyalkanoic acid system family protein [Arenimonas sp.]
MPSIDISRPHALGIAAAKKSVDRVVEHIASKFDVESAWKGNTLEFRRSGVDGHITVDAKAVRVTVELGFLLMAIRGSVEREIRLYLDEEFG